MSPADRLSAWIVRAAWVAPVVAAMAALILWRAWAALPDPLRSARVPEEQGADSSAAYAWAPPVLPATNDWAVLCYRGAAPEAQTALSRRFRLAGTFFAFGLSGTNEVRRAVLDDLQEHAQIIVAEGDRIGEISVQAIAADRVVLRDASGETELSIRFAREASAPGSGSDGAAAGQDYPTPADYPYGIRQVGPARYIFNRGRLMDYYRDLMDEPERLVKVFDSLKPVYAEDNRSITGYVLGVEGERQFFEAAGLQEGDIVRSVNSLPMTNRRRAEYFIKEFVADRASAFVMEVERQGQTNRLIYELR